MNKNDIYLNSFFGDLWIAIDDTHLRLINGDIIEELDNTVGFEKIGSVNKDFELSERIDRSVK